MERKGTWIHFIIKIYCKCCKFAHPVSVQRDQIEQRVFRPSGLFPSALLNPTFHETKSSIKGDRWRIRVRRGQAIMHIGVPVKWAWSVSELDYVNSNSRVRAVINEFLHAMSVSLFKLLFAPVRTSSNVHNFFDGIRLTQLINRLWISLPTSMRHNLRAFSKAGLTEIDRKIGWIMKRRKSAAANSPVTRYRDPSP